MHVLLLFIRNQVENRGNLILLPDVHELFYAPQETSVSCVSVIVLLSLCSHYLSIASLYLEKALGNCVISGWIDIVAVS